MISIKPEGDGWPIALVEKAIRSICSDGVLAKKNFSWPLVVHDMRAWFIQNILREVWDQLLTKGLMMLGASGAGKSPCAKTIAMGVADYHYQLLLESLPEGEFPDPEDKPSFRTAADIDFLRGLVGTKTMVDLFDDGDSDQQPIRKVKAMGDVSEFCPTVVLPQATWP